jgi:hypothetical protein
MYQVIGKNKWDMYANCKYMQNIFTLSLVVSQIADMGEQSSSVMTSATTTTKKKQSLIWWSVLEW